MVLTTLKIQSDWIVRLRTLANSDLGILDWISNDRRLRHPIMRVANGFSVCQIFEVPARVRPECLAVLFHAPDSPTSRAGSIL